MRPWRKRLASPRELGDSPLSLTQARIGQSLAERHFMKAARYSIQHPLRCLACALLTALVCVCAFAQSSGTLTRKDNSTIRMTAYEPAVSACRGTVVVSHGAGGSENGLKYLGQGLRAEGWLAVVVGHKESGLEAVRARMRGRRGLRAALEGLITEPSAYEARFMDIDAAGAWGASHCKSRFKALMGHSMGAATVMLEAGAANKLGLRGQDRFDAYVALSPQGAGSIFPAGAWQGIRKPVLTMTGTRDDELNAEWTSRLEPFKNMQPGCKWLGIVGGATHHDFGGRGAARDKEELTIRTTLAFLADVSGSGDKTCPAPRDSPGIEIKTK